MEVATLHVITACSRLEGLARLAPTLAHPIVRWHVSFDLERRHIGGQAVKNRLLDSIVDGWVWICDDDNIPAPGFLDCLATLLPGITADVVLFGQDRGARGVHSPVLEVGRIDAAQAVMRRETIGGMRLPEIYEGDGVLICRVCAGRPVLFVDEPLTYWNRQSR